MRYIVSDLCFALPFWATGAGFWPPLTEDLRADQYNRKPLLQRVLKGPWVLCRSNNYQDLLKTLKNLLVYLIIQNLGFDYILDVRRNYGFNIQEIRKIHLLGFPIQQLLENISRSLSIDSLFSKYDWIGGSYLGLYPYFILGPNTYLFEA